ncbi:RHS repeat domain-containing protein [Xanthomonas cannabis]|uniref:RHS repeat domain-containing protein n=1 Tax=Xanthomonas cannabis TaxID=1885674 RepID=UPI001FBA45D0|nr:RHS repeat domain-containing protein [Xanthomonas cannabis]NIK17963.1 RHS repeat-associated protein [Xanthomonas cannabis]
MTKSFPNFKFIVSLLFVSSLLAPYLEVRAQDSQCTSQGGKKVCTEHADNWEYMLCDRMGASVAAYAAWCRARGGVYKGLYASPECEGGDSTTNESNIVPLSENYYAERTGCPAESTVDSGWGQTSQQDFLCWSGSPQYQQGQLVSDLRLITVSGSSRDSKGQCSTPGGQIAFVARKDRTLRCPIGFEALLDASGNWIGCFNHKDNTCPINNPVFPESGGQIRKEVDYVSGSGPLRLERTYSPTTDYIDQGQSRIPEPNFSSSWHFNYGMRIDTVVNSPSISAIATRPDGEKLYFDRNGIQVHSLSGKLQAKLMADETGTWTLHRGTDKERYDESGNLIEILQSNGNKVSISRDARNRKILASDSQGRQLILHYLPSLHISHVILPDGEKIKFQYYSPKDSLTEVIHQDGTSIKYEFNDTYDPGFKIFDESGSWYSWHRYDYATKRVTQSNLSPAVNSGATALISYKYTKDGEQGSSTEITYPLGKTEKISFRLINGVSKLVSQTASCTSCATGKTVTYDANGFTDSSIDFLGTETRYTYSKDGLLSKKIESSNNGKFKRTTSTIWDHNLQVPIKRSVQDFSGLTVATTLWEYNDRGQTLTVSQTGPVAAARVATRRYCEDDAVAAGTCLLPGLLLSSDGPRADTADSTSYSYYLSDDSTCATAPTVCQHRKGDLQKVTNALGRVTEYLAYDGAGRPLSIKDANGIVTDYTYHPRGWLTATKVRGSDASSEADDRITRIDYWPTGLVKRVTQPDGAFTAFTYDAAHRLTDITDNAGNTVHYTLDNAGNRIKEDTSDASGTLKRTLSRVYNQLGQLKTQATAASDPTDFEYDANGNATKVTDALATATQSEYDPLNRLSRTLQDVAGIKADTTFDYDALDSLTKVTDPKGLDTKYEYNGFGDLVKLTSPDTGVTSYTYDSAGNRATQTDARGNTTAYSYDALNRLTKVTYPTTSLNVTYTYDATQTTCASGETFSIGRLTRMQDGGAITQYCYNRFGDLVRKVQTTNAQALVLRYDYTAGGQLRRMTYPDGAVVDYVRNAQGQTTEVGVTPAGGSRQVLLGNASYYPFGPASGWTYGNGRTLARQYDLDYRPQAIQDTRPGGLEVGFGFDPAGNLTALTPAGNPTPEIGLGYDALGRLTGLKDGSTGTLIDGYSYDATGNRLSAKVGAATQSYTYPTDSHRLSAVAGVARTYDATGNTTAIGGTARQYTYDTTGRMTQARRAGAVTMNYRYNGRGEQVRRFLGTTNTYTLYDEAGHWLGDYDTNGAPKQQAIWLDDLPVGLLANANTLHYIEPDHLGSPRVVIDPTRDVAVWTWSLKGEAFGNTAPNQDPDGDGAALVLDMRFPGQRYDAASGLNQNYFRDYEAATGRYGQSDPIGLRGGINTFGYASQAPFVHTDFYGLATWKGSTFGVGVGAGKFGLNIDFYQVTSPCPGGGLASAYVMAVGGAGGLGSPISMTGSQVELTDSNDVPDPDVFNGPYAKFSAGSVSFGLGYQMYQKISIGGAWWNFGAGAESTGWHQSQGGFDAAIYGAAVGNAVVIQQKKCLCEAQ